VDAGSTVQRQLSDYLQYELYHILGAYGIVEKRHGKLARELDRLARLHSRDQGDLHDHEPHSNQLAYLARLASRYNWQLGSYRHGRPRDRKTMKPFDTESVGWPFRDPIPDELPLTAVKRFELTVDDREVQHARAYPWKESYIWERIPRFYSEAIHALEAYGDEPTRAEGDRFRQYRFAASLIAQRDGAIATLSEPLASEPAAFADRVWRRINRYVQRRANAHQALGPRESAPSHEESEHGRYGDPSIELDSRLDSLYRHDPEFLERLCSDNLSTGGDSLPLYVVRVLAEAHLSMHAVEAWLSMCLGEHAEAHTAAARQWLVTELDRCIALNTFAFSISRTAPWLFAADRHESAAVFGNFPIAWENLVPARGMWIAGQIGLLALHRRAYARALKGESVFAYNDYHKLQRMIRDAERRVRAAPIHVDGALEFLAALDAQAHHHIGELYRDEHAHRPARTHFSRANHRLDALRARGEMADVLTNSRWSIELQVSHGKASYEMGRHKEALCWHLRGWQSFLRLLAADTETAANTNAIQTAIDWLERVRYEPELRKSELAEHMRPVVGQLERVTVSRRYGALAGEILLRLGHLLLVLNLGGEFTSAANEDEHLAKHTLAYACLRKALDCDAYSTLINTDQLKAGIRLGAADAGRFSVGGKRDQNVLLSVGAQWPRGGNDFEQLARAAEYLTLWRQRTLKLAKGEGEGKANVPVARELLLSFFMNTDSINVRKSQIYRLLMHDARPSHLPGATDAPAIEFICMRRYSSAFPLLPRPSAFRALGGGYFIRLHNHGSGETADPFGIVIDPGVDFVENLYRTGYSLGDINMIVITHDHVDHSGSLDILLSLLHVRARTLRHERVTETQPPITILMCKSVFARYASAKQLKTAREFAFQCIDNLSGGEGDSRGCTE
jgi:metallo-beta-lactamase superfamily protein